MEYEALIRITVFVAVAVLLAVWELAARRRPAQVPGISRWLWNLGLIVVGTLCLRAVAVVTVAGLAVGAALWAEAEGLGLMTWLGLPRPLAWAAGFLVLDLAIYLQHVATHRIPVLWRLHQVHHTDVDLDFSTGVRFHPVELVVSMVWKCAVVVALGIPAGAVLAFEVVLNAMALFNHANIRIPARAEPWLRALVVTPDMHRVHHSVYQRETDSNFGFNLSCWDRIFGTYRAQPRDGHEGMALGLTEHRNARQQDLWWLLRLPWFSQSTTAETRENDP